MFINKGISMKNLSLNYIKFILTLKVLLSFNLNASTNLPTNINDGATINLLKKYKAINPSFNIDPNFAFLADNQNPTIKIYYKNDKGQFKYRIYKSSIDSIGLKFWFAINLNLVFFTGNLDFINTKKILKIKNGFSVNSLGLKQLLGLKIPFLNDFIEFFINGEVAYCSLENAPGGLIIFTLPVGWHVSAFSYISGGTLIPEA